MPRYLSFTLASIANFTPSKCRGSSFLGGDDNCEDLNGTWILGERGNCIYGHDGTAVDCTEVANGFIRFAAGINNVGSDIGLEFNVSTLDAGGGPIGIATYEWRSGGSTPIACMSIFAGKVLDRTFLASGGDKPFCDWPATVTCNGAA